MDEARFGQQGTTTRKSARRRSRPTAVKQTRYERVCLRRPYLSNRAYDNYKHPHDEGAEAWQQLTPDALKSVCACSYVMPENKG
jgi:hypothetical protein